MKSVGPRTEPLITPALTEYPWEEFPSNTTQSHILLKKCEIWPNTPTAIPYDLHLCRRPTCQTLLKALDIIVL